MPQLTHESRSERSEDAKAFVAEWPIERIAALDKKCAVPKSRLAALLGIGAGVFAKLADGTYTPSPALCRRMAALEGMAERGEIHGQYVPDKLELQRRMTLFRAWFMEKPAAVDFPRVTLSVKFAWGAGPYSCVVLPIEAMPQLRLTKWEGLVQIVQALTVAMRKLARGNSRLLWRTTDEEFWSRYARETLPEIVEQRAKALEEKLERARASKHV